jgi:mono/diheme cytochrome c family protein
MMSKRAFTAMVAAVICGWLGAQAAVSAQGVGDAVVQTAPYSSVEDIAAASNGQDKGKQLFSYWCSSCHGSGHDHPGTAALEKKYQGKLPALLEERSDITPNLTRYYVRTGVTPMPFFRKTEISDSELDAIADYLARNIPTPSK